MSATAYHWAAQTVALFGTAAAVVAATVAFRSWKWQRNPIDLAFTVATTSWLMHLVSSRVNALAAGDRWAEVAFHASYQITLISVAFFVLLSASVTRFSIHAIWMGQGVIGLLLLAWSSWTSLPQDLAYRLWATVNLTGTSTLSLYLGLNAMRRGTPRCWLALGGSLLGMGICLEGMLGAEGMRPGATFAQYFYATFILFFWLFVTNRAGWQDSATSKETEDSSLLSWDAVTGFGPANKVASAAVATERQRIAQDLHDGVGSQLVNILATLDARAPHHQLVALALEQCLTELKMTVDGIDNTNDGLIDVLGRLRYRVQHSLDKLGIRMIWKMDIDGPLQELRGDRAQQVLRIAQECLSNIMRHAHASVVEVICAYDPASDSIFLEVKDNGLGIPSREAGRPLGKGLENMRLRACKLGGHLQIATKARAGTRMRLIVPLHALGGRLSNKQASMRDVVVGGSKVISDT